MANNSAVIFIALYLLAVVYHGNSQQLLSELKQEKSFVLWLIAVIIVYQIYSNNWLGSTGHMLIGLAIVGALLGSGASTKFFDYLNTTFTPTGA